jgi:hypothetical protein
LHHFVSITVFPSVSHFPFAARTALIVRAATLSGRGLSPSDPSIPFQPFAWSFAPFTGYAQTVDFIGYAVTGWRKKTNQTINCGGALQ